jgi:hypothetical protein
VFGPPGLLSTRVEAVAAGGSAPSPRAIRGEKMIPDGSALGPLRSDSFGQ